MKTRKVERKHTDITGQCCTSQGKLFDITVSDLTEGGCRFRDADNSLFAGAQLTLMIAGSGPYRCFVRWRDKSDVGVSFVQPLTAEILDQLVNGKPVKAAPSASLNPAPEVANGQSPDAASFGPLRRVC